MLDPFSPIIHEQAYLNTYTQEEKARRAVCNRNKDFYYDKQDKYVDTFNIEAKPVTIPLVRPIVDKRCSMLYRSKLVRDIVGPASSISFLESLYSDNDMDNILLQADLLSEITGTVLLSLIKDENMSSGYRIVLWNGSNISAVSDDQNTNYLDALSLIKEVQRLSSRSVNKQVQVESLTYQQIWTKDSITYYEGTTKKNTMENPYGYIPFTAIKGREVMNQFYGFSPVTSISNMNNSINQMVSDLTYTIKLHGANPIALQGFQGGEQLIIQPGKAINLPAGATADVLEFNPKINEVLEAIKYLEQKIYEVSSVPEVSIVGSEGTSGRELLVRWYPLVQIFEEKAIRFQKYELEAANNFLAMAGLEPVESITVNYNKDEILPLSPEEDRIEEDIRLNLTNPSTILQKRNPNLTEDDANSIIIDNKEVNQELQTMNGPGGQQGVNNG